MCPGSTSVLTRANVLSSSAAIQNSGIRPRLLETMRNRPGRMMPAKNLCSLVEGAHKNSVSVQRIESARRMRHGLRKPRKLVTIKRSKRCWRFFSRRLGNRYAANRREQGRQQSKHAIPKPAATIEMNLSHLAAEEMSGSNNAWKNPWRMAWRNRSGD